MYLGAHSSNQILIGLLFSLIFVTLYRYFLLKILYQLYWKLMNPGKLKYIISLILIYVIVLGIPIAINLVNVYTRTVDQRLIDRYNLVCEKEETY
jgi:hypothetical protein